MISLHAVIMVIAMMLGLANAMKDFTVTDAQVNFLSFLQKLYEKLWQQNNIFCCFLFFKKNALVSTN